MSHCLEGPPVSTGLETNSQRYRTAYFNTFAQPVDELSSQDNLSPGTAHYVPMPRMALELKSQVLEAMEQQRQLWADLGLQSVIFNPLETLFPHWYN